jgi:hypothetical protein
MLQLATLSSSTRHWRILYRCSTEEINVTVETRIPTTPKVVTMGNYKERKKGALAYR